MNLKELKNHSKCYYSTDNGILLNADCIEIIPDIESVDLIICDPPYFKTINECWDKQWKTEQDYLDWCKLWFIESEKKLKKTGSFYCYGNFDILTKQKILIFDKYLIFRQNITLNKGLKSIAGRTSNKLRMFPTATEYLLFYIKQNIDSVLLDQRDYLLDELKKSGLTLKQIKKMLGFSGNQVYNWFSPKNKGDASWQFIKQKHYEVLQKTGYWKKSYDELKIEYNNKRTVFNLPYGVTDVWDFIPDKIKYGHPTQKPRNLSMRIIEASSRKNDVVLIPFGGSGSEIIECEKLNRKWISCETKKEYCDIISKRLKHESSQLNLLNYMTGL